MTNVTEIDLSERMRRDDAPLLELVDQWETAYHKFSAEPEGRVERAAQMEALEGQIVRYRPATFFGLGAILQMAHTILSARDANPDVYIARAPATALVACAIAATEYADGMIDKKKAKE